MLNPLSNFLPFLSLFFQVITFFAFIFFSFWIKNYYPKYFEEKGKNLATKEDIAEITNLVEQVRYSFTKDTEKLKANLFLLTSLQVGLFSEEKNAIIDFNEKFFKWQQMLTDSSLGGIDDRSKSELEKYKTMLQQSYIDFLNSETRFNLFVENNELTAFANKIKIETLKHLSVIIQHYIINLSSNNFYDGLNKSNTSNPEYFNKNKELLLARTELTKDFNEKMLAELRDLVPLYHEFKMICRNHLYKLLNQQEQIN